MKKLTIFFDCGTPRIFEDASYKYLFRTGAHATMDNVAAARYVLARNKNVNTIAGINQNYSWGTDSWNDFKASMQALKPGTSTLLDSASLWRGARSIHANSSIRPSIESNA